MAKRLVKIAKELNVGTTTIVDYLNNNGFDIENKPTSKVSDEMYDELLKEFQKSIAIKEQADQLVIGTRPATKEKEPVKKIFDTPTPTPVEKVEEVVIKQESVAKEEPKEVVEKLVNRPVIGLKVKGKIDLDKKPTPKAKKVEKAPKPEVEEPKPKTVQEPKAVEKPEVIEEPKAVEKPEVIEEPKAVEKPTPVKKIES